MSASTRWHDAEARDSSSIDSRYSDSDHSHNSQSTAATDYTSRLSLQQYASCHPRMEGCDRGTLNTRKYNGARASIDTYASTILSGLELPEEFPDYGARPCERDYYASDAIPATPREFAELFPSKERLLIHHDDAAIDGNMNLRVDTEVILRGGAASGKRCKITLFHLRMYDLKHREFSLRRYCRESGREVCHSVRKYQTSAAGTRPSLRRSFSSALAVIRPKQQSKPSISGPKRSDSGCSSMDADDDIESRLQTASNSEKVSLMPTNTIKLEFSNYAHVDVKRRGAGSQKRYEFEYWGVNYAWKRAVKQRGDLCEVSYHLVKDWSDLPLAYIVPVPMTTAERQEEDMKGGWIPPCSMWIQEDDILEGVSDLPEYVFECCAEATRLC